MCNVSTKYQSLIDQLVKNTYPAMHQSLNSISANEFALHSLSVKGPVRDFQKEFRSLESFEKKLIFPSILSIFVSEEQRRTHVPDIDAIINLTATREDRLQMSMKEISEILQQNKIADQVRKDVNELMELDLIFYNDFLPSKKLWKEYLLCLHDISGNCANKMNGYCLCASRVMRDNALD